MAAKKIRVRCRKSPAWARSGALRRALTETRPSRWRVSTRLDAGGRGAWGFRGEGFLVGVGEGPGAGAGSGPSLMAKAEAEPSARHFHAARASPERGQWPSGLG